MLNGNIAVEILHKKDRVSKGGIFLPVIEATASTVGIIRHIAPEVTEVKVGDTVKLAMENCNGCTAIVEGKEYHICKIDGVLVKYIED